jgi:hypothetical protein
MKSSIFVVLGMHRCGTSAVTRGLRALGISLGTDLLPPTADNETGYWEDKDLYAFNEELLAAIEERWCSVRLYESHLQEFPELPALQARARDLLAAKLATYAAFGFKDPRSSRLLTFWSRVFESLNLAPEYVIVTRNPLSVAQSLLKRDGLRGAQSYLLWLQHMLASLHFTEDSPRVVVEYDQMLSDPAGQLLRIRSVLNLPEPENSTALLADYANGFLREDLRHTRYDEESLRQSVDVPPSVIALHRLLTALARDELSPSDSKCKRQISEIWQSMHEFSSAFSLAEAALREEISLNGTLREKSQELQEHAVALTNLTTTSQEQRRYAEGLETRLTHDEERRARLDLALVEATEEIRGIATDLATRSCELARFEESLQRSDARANELANELLMHDRKLQWLTERSQRLAKANSTLAQIADYEQKRGMYAEQLCGLIRTMSDLTAKRLSVLSKSDLELRARHRDTLHRLERIESGSFWRYTRHARSLWNYIETRLLGRNLAFQMIPNEQLAMLPRDHAWRSIGDDPSFELISLGGHLPRGWVIIATTLESAAGSRAAKLYADYGHGFSENCMMRLCPAHDGSVRQIVHISRGLKALRWDPVDAPGELIQGPITMSEISGVGRPIRMLLRVLSVLRNYPDDVLRNRNLTARRVLTDLSRAYLDASELLATSPLHTPGR